MFTLLTGRAALITGATKGIGRGLARTVADTAHSALFLAGEEAGYITGQTIIVDGGQLLVEPSA